MALRGIHEISMVLNESMGYIEECFDSHFGHRGERPPPHETMAERLARIRKEEVKKMLSGSCH